MLYAVDSKGKAWAIWQTKKMPTNFLIAKGGTIIAIADGCDPSAQAGRGDDGDRRAESFGARGAAAEHARLQHMPYASSGRALRLFG